MQLTTTERTALRKVVRNNPRVLQHVSKPGEINALPKDKLIAVAEALGIDVATVIIGDGAPPIEGDLDTLEGQALWRYSQKHPAFEGSFEFELAFELLGQRVIRQARVNYSYTPEWEHYDLNKRELSVGWERTSIAMEVLGDPSGDHHIEASAGQLHRQRPKPQWVKIDILQIGVLPNALVDEIYVRIDDLARAEDTERRARLTTEQD